MLSLFKIQNFLSNFTFLVKPNGYKSVIGYSQETFSSMSIALCCLAVPSIFIGFLSKDLIVGVGNDFFSTAIYNNPKTIHIFDAEFAAFFYKILPVSLSLFGASLSFFLYNFQSNLLFSIKTSSLGRKVFTFLNKKWFFDKIYNECFGQSFFKFGYSVSYKSIDRGVFEIMGPTGLSTTTLKVASQIHKSQTKSLYHYTLISLTSVAFLLCLRQVWVIFEYNIDFRSAIIILISFLFISNIKQK